MVSLESEWRAFCWKPLPEQVHNSTVENVKPHPPEMAQRRRELGYLNKSIGAERDGEMKCCTTSWAVLSPDLTAIGIDNGARN